MDENVTFSKSDLNHNNQGGDFVLEERIKRHKIAPKRSISKETWKIISRSIDDIESIYVSVKKMLGLELGETYRDIDLYHEIVKWRAVLRSSQLLENPNEQSIKNIYETLSGDIDNLTEKLNENINYFWSEVASGIPIEKVKLNVFKVFPDIELNDLYSEGSSNSE